MGISLNEEFAETGIWVNLYPVAPFGDGPTLSESVCLSSHPMTVGAGPSDDELVVINALNKRPYKDTEIAVFQGQTLQPFIPQTEDDLEFVEEGSDHFCCVHMFGSVRRALDVWETYFGHKLTSRDQPKIELIPFVDWNNAQAGDRFIETGFQVSDEGVSQPFCLSFDVLAHECAHIIMFDQIGTPTDQSVTTTYKAFHEAAADWMSLISVLHFDSFLEDVLDSTGGDLYQPNQWSRFGQVSETAHMRLASNGKRMSQVASPHVCLDDLGARELHEMAEPLIGALFDIYAGIYRDCLIESGVPLPDVVDPASDHQDLVSAVSLNTEAFYDSHRELFVPAMKTARDVMGYFLAEICKQLPADYLSFESVTEAIFISDEIVSDGRYRDVIYSALTWREIL